VSYNVGMELVGLHLLVTALTKYGPDFLEPKVEAAMKKISGRNENAYLGLLGGAIAREGSQVGIVRERGVW
jgi:hypothetical protein